MKTVKRNDFIKNKKVPIEIPQWGKTVYIRVMNAKGIMQYWETLQKVKAGLIPFAELQAIALINSVVDKKGNYILASADAEKIADMDGAALWQLWNEVNKIQKLGFKTTEEVKAEIKNAPKNSSVEN